MKFEAPGTASRRRARAARLAFLCRALLVGSFAALPSRADAQSTPIVHDGIGDRLCPLNDVDGDTCADFAFDDGCGWLWVLSGKTGRPLAKVEGDRDSSRHSRAAALFADIDADGAWDLVDWHGDARRQFQLLLRSGTDLHVLRELEIPHGFRVADGAAPTAAGDWNGDGVPDVAIGARDESGACILVLSGKDGARLCACRGVPTGEPSKDAHAIGTSVKSAVRVGRADRVLGSVYDSSHVILWRLEDVDHPALIPLLTRYCDGSREFAFVGDRDGDGAPDVALAMGTELANPKVYLPNPVARRALLVSGKTGVELAEIQVGATNLIDGVSGTEIADIDGDGVREYLVAYTGFVSGETLVYSGKTNRVLCKINEAEACCADACRFGASSACLGDVDGDGVDDYAIGSNGGIDGVFPGCVSVFSGKSGRKLYSIWKRDLFR